MAIEFMAQQREQPWLMSVNVFDPHGPFDPPQSHLNRYHRDNMPAPLSRKNDPTAHARLGPVDGFGAGTTVSVNRLQEIQAAYYAMITLIDDNVGRMLDALEHTQQCENTIVIFMSNHGEMLGDHGLLAKGCRFYEGLVRVPLIISWAGHFASGVVSDALVELTDIAPTLLEVAGTPVPERIQGRSLAPILGGTADPHTHRDLVRCEYYRALNPDAAGREVFTGTYATMIRDRCYKLAVYHDRDVGELFDLQADPGEFENRWENRNYGDVRFNLMKQSFDALALAVDVGSKQVVQF